MSRQGSTTTDRLCRDVCQWGHWRSHVIQLYAGKYSRSKYHPQNTQDTILFLGRTKRNRKSGKTAGIGVGANKRLEGIRRLFGVGRIGRMGKSYDSTLVGAKNLSPG